MSSIYQRPSGQASSQAAGYGEEEKKVNLWYDLLKSVGVRGQSKEAHLIILGDKGVGKRSLIKAINKPFLR